MSDAGGGAFEVDGDTYDLLIGRYSARLAVRLADAAGVAAGHHAIDVGCGPGGLTTELVRRLGAHGVAAIDPSESFTAECRRRNPGVAVHLATAEALPFDDDRFDVALAQLVLHFVSDPPAATAEMRRVVRPGGVLAACVWDVGGGMQAMRAFWDAALTVDPGAPDEDRTRPFGREAEIADLFEATGLRDVTAGALDVEATYTGFDDLWAGFAGGVGPTGSYCVSLDPDRRAAVREALHARLAAPPGPFTLTARAWYATGRA